MRARAHEISKRGSPELLAADNVGAPELVQPEDLLVSGQVDVREGRLAHVVGVAVEAAVGCGTRARSERAEGGT
eukprot:6206611-Pleurochrysis_carterae.AAC.1